MKSNFLIWGITGVLALAIVAGAVAVSRGRVQDAPPPVVPPVSDPVVAVASPVPQAQGRAQIVLPARMAGALRLSIAGLPPGSDRFPLEHSCYGRNVPPSLTWTGAPRGTKSIVVMLERADNESDPFLAWAAYGIAADEGAVPGGAQQAVTDRGTPLYAGPCEPKGRVPYVFSVYALDVMPMLDRDADRDTLIRAMNGHILDRAVLRLEHFRRL